MTRLLLVYIIIAIAISIIQAIIIVNCYIVIFVE